MNISKFSVVVVIILNFFCTNAFSANECDKSQAASNVIELIKVYEVDLSELGLINLEEAEVNIQEGQFCIDAKDKSMDKTLKVLNSLKFCNNLIMMGRNFFPGQVMGIKAKSPENQAALEQAIWDYSQLYKATNETSFFGCDLKTLKFPAIGK